MRGAPLAFVFALAVACAITGFYMGWYCVGNENRDPALADNEVCDLLGPTPGLRWWLAVLWPSALFGISQLSETLRRHSVLAGAVATALAATFWIVIGLAVVDV